MRIPVRSAGGGLLGEDAVKSRQRDCRNAAVERVCFANGSYDVCRVGANRVKGAVGAFPDGRRSRSLAFERHDLLPSLDDEIHLGAASRAVERNVCIWIETSDIRQHHLFPAATERRMRVDFIERLESQERTCQTGVADIDLGRLHEPLAEVGHERRNDIHHERLLEQVDVSSDCHVGDAQRRRKPRIVDHLRVLVRKHLPKPAHRLGHKIPPEQEIPFKKSLDEGFVPIIRFVIVRRKISTRKPAAKEILRPIRSFEFAEEKGRQPLIADSTGQRLGALANEIARGGAKDEEMPVSAPFVAKASDYGEEVASALDFVNADKFPAVAGEKQFWIGELCKVGRSFKVKIYGNAQFFTKMLYQRGFSALAGSNHCGYRVSPKSPLYAFLKPSVYVCVHPLDPCRFNTCCWDFADYYSASFLCGQEGQGRRSRADGKPQVKWEPKVNRWTGAAIPAVLKGAALLDWPWMEVPVRGLAEDGSPHHAVLQGGCGAVGNARAARSTKSRQDGARMAAVQVNFPSCVRGADLA